MVVVAIAAVGSHNSAMHLSFASMGVTKVKNCLRSFVWPLLVVLAACQTVPPPTIDLSDAALRIEQAEAVDAQSHAPVELQFARDKLARAQALHADKDYAGAARLTAEARADADLAHARARAAQLRLDVANQTRANEALRVELLGQETP